MKILCDVCEKDEAFVFCTADEAALCQACDHRVHHVNKLASKHQRFSLLHPSDNHFPVCDICQERRAFMFCQQDRAILCRDCDVSIHLVNEHTQKHDRFLLTGLKLSHTCSLNTPSSSSEATLTITGRCPFNSDPNSQPTATASATVSSSTSNAPIATASTSSISDYLIETLPGWHFEEFLDSSSDHFGFCKNDTGDGISPVPDETSSRRDSFSSRRFRCCCLYISTEYRNSNYSCNVN